MDIDKQSQQFILTPDEVRALYIDQSLSECPIDRAECLLTLAQSAQGINLDRQDVLPNMVPGPERSGLQRRLEKDSQVVSAIIQQLEPYLPPVADGVEEFLQRGE